MLSFKLGYESRTALMIQRPGSFMMTRHDRLAFGARPPREPPKGLLLDLRSRLLLPTEDKFILALAKTVAPYSMTFSKPFAALPTVRAAVPAWPRS